MSTIPDFLLKEYKNGNPATPTFPRYKPPTRPQTPGQAQTPQGVGPQVGRIPNGSWSPLTGAPFVSFPRVPAPTDRVTGGEETTPAGAAGAGGTAGLRQGALGWDGRDYTR